ncbi:hypothetical protein [Amycolatopsis australiensis]|uniref:Uncharacterized protein n=1 Tax=Amycolatopsis australiensis TaxID=546364 RepID=A0A1K1RWB5_9PSEU|nr:hypothetical protein [Amycolatopsis australiensis]SFW76117.1 hypothetical protein SAMN04489730_4061 [Amycolatopsis australiensis]
MRSARIAAAAGAVALIALSCSACRDDLVGSPDNTPPTSELSGIESTLNGIESDMNSDGTP